MKDNNISFSSIFSLEDGSSSPLVDCTLYTKLIKSLFFLTHTCLDLSYAVSVVSRYMQDPHEIHWKEANRILHYVQGTIDYGIHYAAREQLDLT